MADITEGVLNKPVEHLTELAAETGAPPPALTPKEMLESLRLYSPLNLPKQPITFLVDNVWPEHMLTVLCGTGGSGKSTLALYWCKDILKDHDVLYLDKDNNLSVVQDCLTRVGFHTTLPPNFYYWGDWHKDAAGNERPVSLIENPYIVQLLAELHNPVVVVETLRTFAKCDENDSKEMSEFISQCKRLSNRYKATVIVIHHNNRNGGYRGSSAISDDSDNVLALDSEKDEDNNIISMTVTPLKSKVRLKKTTYTMTDIGLTQTLVSTDDRLYSLLQSHPGVSQNSLEKLAGGFASRNKIRDFVTRYMVAKKIERRNGLLYASNVAAVTHGVLEDDETEIHEETGRK